MVLNIDATVNNREPDYKIIEDRTAECRMPLCYGDGIKKIKQAQRVFASGVEKIAMSAAIINSESLISKISSSVGVRSVAVVLDVKKKLLGKYEVYIHNGKKATGKNSVLYAKQLQDAGAGEIIINSIDHDGVMNGYDIALNQKIRNVLQISITILGGAGSLTDIKQVINKFGTLGVAAGSLFVFKEIYRAFLINYPTKKRKKSLYK